MDFEKRIYRIVGKRIRQARINAEITQNLLAQKVNLGRTSVTNIEEGRQKIQLHTLFAIANALNITAHDLISDIDFQEKSYDELLEEKTVITMNGEKSLEKSDKDRIIDLLTSENE